MMDHEEIQMIGKSLAMEVWALAKSDRPHTYDEAKRLIRQELHSLYAKAQPEWQPIETAPDKGDYLVINEEEEYSISTEDDRHWEWTAFEATHWQPFTKPQKKS